MKKTFKMAMLAACTVLCLCFTSCFGPVAETSGGNSEDEVEYDIEQYKVRNFTVTQREGTNVLIFRWEKPKKINYRGGEPDYWITVKEAPEASDADLLNLSGFWQRSESSDSTMEEEYLMTLGYRINRLKSGTYTFEVKERYAPDGAEVSASVEYKRNILIPTLQLNEIYKNTANQWVFEINSLAETGNNYAIVYVSKTDDISNAFIPWVIEIGRIVLGSSDTTGFIDNDYYPELKDGDSCYMWVKLADDVEYDEEGNIIDSDKYGKPSNSVHFTLPESAEEKNPSPIKNFTVKQKEGTNFLIFSWEKLEGYDELAYQIYFVRSDDNDEYIQPLYFKTKDITREFLMKTTTSGTYTFAIRSHDGKYEEESDIRSYDFDYEKELTASVNYTRVIIKPELEISRQYMYRYSGHPEYHWNDTARFILKDSALLKNSGNKYLMVYIGLTDNFTDAKIKKVELESDIKKECYYENDVYYEDDYFEICCPFVGLKEDKPDYHLWTSDKTYYMWLKLADELVYDNETEDSNSLGELIDSETYGPVSDVFEFKL